MLKKNPLLVSLVLATFATLFVYSYISNREKVLLELSTSVDVVVAAQDIPARTTLEKGMLEVVKIPKKYIQPGAVMSLDKILDQTISLAVLKGTQISEGMFQGGNEVSFSEKVPKGKRAFTLAVSKVTAVANLLVPGNYVDLLVTVEVGDSQENGQEVSEAVLTKTFLQNKMVLAVNEISSRRQAMFRHMQQKNEGSVFSQRLGDGEGREDIVTLTLALTPEEVQYVNLAQEVGSVAVGLRSRWDEGVIVETESIDTKDLLGIEKKVIRKSTPAWLEIRGAEQKLHQ